MVRFYVTDLLRKFQDAEGILRLPKGTPEFRENLGEVLSDLREICTGFTLSEQLLRQVDYILARSRGDTDERTTRILLEPLVDSVKLELVKPLFLMVPQQDAELFSMPDHNVVSERFSAASKDLDEARKCFALERYTASVFHSMRVVEYLLRELVRSVPMGIYLPDMDVQLTYDDMGQVYKKLKDKLDAVRGQRKSDDREAQLQFFSDAGDQCLFFMAVRNEMSHARGSATRLRALEILERVSRFTERLAVELPQRS